MYIILLYLLRFDCDTLLYIIVVSNNSLHPSIFHSIFPYLLTISLSSLFLMALFLSLDVVGKS